MSSELIKNVDLTERAKDSTWVHAEKYLLAKNTIKFLGVLAFQEVDYAPLEASLRDIVQLVDRQLNTPGNYVDLNDVTQQAKALSPGKVIVQPRGSFASRTALRGHVDLDLDLCFPENFKIALKTSKGLIQRSIGQVLGALDFLDNPRANGRDASGNQVFTKDGLRFVMLYVWGKLISDNPDAFALEEQYFPGNITDHSTMVVQITRPVTMRIHPDKTLSTLTRSISAQITSNRSYPNLDVDFFVKVVTTRFGGQEVLVGVDKDGPLGVRQYQVTTFIPSGKEWIGSLPLKPIGRTALIALKWWKNSIKDDNTIPMFQVRDPSLMKTPDDPTVPIRDRKLEDIKIKSHHFLAALNALHELPVTDPLYVPTHSSLPFSLVRVIDVMIKILTFLSRAYSPPQRFGIVLDHNWSNDIPPNVIDPMTGQATRFNDRVIYPFPVESLDVFDTIYRQASTNVPEYEALIKSEVIPKFISRLHGALQELAKEIPAYTPSTYTFEDLS